MTTNGAPDQLSDRDLAQLVLDVRAGVTEWTSPRGRAAFANASRRLARLARKLGAEPAEALAHAWNVWQNELTEAQIRLNADHLWGFTAAIVTRHLSHEQVAQRHLTSVEDAKRGRVLHVIDGGFLEDVDQEAPATVTAPRTLPHTHRLAMAVLTNLLIAAGLTPTQRDQVIDMIAAQLNTTTDTKAACDRLLRKADGLPLPIGVAQFKALVQLALGTPKGTPGLLHLVGAGHPSPTAEPHIARLVKRLMPEAA